MTSVRIEINRAGIGELLKSSEVQSMLMSKADAVASSARSRAPLVEGEPGDTPLPIEVSAAPSDRARAIVAANHPSALAVEAKHRLLGGSLDAAR